MKASDDVEYIDYDLYEAYELIRNESLINLNLKNDDSFRVT